MAGILCSQAVLRSQGLIRFSSLSGARKQTPRTAIKHALSVGSPFYRRLMAIPARINAKAAKSDQTTLSPRIKAPVI